MRHPPLCHTEEPCPERWLELAWGLAFDHVSHTPVPLLSPIPRSEVRQLQAGCLWSRQRPTGLGFPHPLSRPSISLRIPDWEPVGQVKWLWESSLQGDECSRYSDECSRYSRQAWGWARLCWTPMLLSWRPHCGSEKGCGPTSGSPGFYQWPLRPQTD